MKNRAYLFFLCSFALSSCGGKGLFSFKNDPNLCFFDRNGDLALLEKGQLGNVGIPEISKEANIDDLIRKIEMKEDFFLLYFQEPENCRYCAFLEPKLAEMIYDSQLEVFCHRPIYNDPQIIRLRNVYPESNFQTLVDNLATPVIHFISSKGENPTASLVNFYENQSTTAALETYFDPLFNLTSIYRFSSFEAFSKFDYKNFLIFADYGDEQSASFYHEYLQEKAKNHDKILVYLELNKMSESDCESFFETLGFDRDHPYVITKKGAEPISYLDEPERALDLINSYYS